MASFFSDPKTLVAVDLQNWLDCNPNHTLDFKAWKIKGKFRMIGEGISPETYEWVMEHQGFPHVRGLIEQLKRQYKNAPKRDHEKELLDFQRDYQKLVDRSVKTSQRKIIILMRMKQQSFVDISKVIGKSAGYVEREFEKLKTEGWCGE